MKEKIKAELLRRRPQYAEGRICVELTDPLTGKVKDRIRGQNHIFTDVFFGAARAQDQYSDKFSSWVKTISQAQLLLTDSVLDITDTLPYICGNVIGTGLPSNAGSGLYQGAFNVANQKLASFDGDSVNWKFQYDYTTAQANGTIGTMGLSYQYLNLCCGLPEQIPSCNSESSYNYNNTNDGRYVYSTSVYGVITKRDLLMGTSVSIDKSAVIGSDSNVTKKVGYNPANGHYYISTYHYNTPASRNLYEFSDNTFATLLATYTISSMSYSYYNYEHPVYVYGNYLFYFYGTTIYVCDYVNNNAYTTIVPEKSVLLPSLNHALQYYPLPFQGRYLHLGSYYNPESPGVIFDLATQTVIAWMHVIYPPYAGSYLPYQSMLLYPVKNIPCYAGIVGQAGYFAYSPTMLVRTAIAAKKLDAPVVKTTANGMTVTYELEVTYG